MAKSRRSNRVNSQYPSRRDTSLNRQRVWSVPRTFVSSNRSAWPVRFPLSPLQQLEDRRTWHPDNRMMRPVAATVRSAKRIIVNPVGPLTAPLRFADPRRVVVCIRRAIRKRIMHAKGVAGGRVRRPKRTPWSSISCK